MILPENIISRKYLFILDRFLQLTLPDLSGKLPPRHNG
jgi:hypothetical protein